MKHTTKRILVLLLALLMALPAVSFAAAADTEIVARGKYGARITWTLDADGTLTIAGSGNMDVYSGKNGTSPWSNDSRIKTVVVSPGITSVGAGAFMNCKNLKTVVLPESLTKVYASAFSGCTALQYVLFAGSEAKWNQIRTEGGSHSLPRVNVIGSFPLPVPGGTPQSDPDIRFGVVDWGCEDGVVWIYDGSETLTFTGSGTVMDLFAGCDVADAYGNIIASPDILPPWAQYLTDGCTVVLEECITGVSGFAFSANVGLKELIVLNPACDLSALDIKEPTFLRGFLDSTAERYAGTHRDCLFLPLCPADHRHTVIPDAGVEPTECSGGYSEGIYCVDCGDFFYGHRALSPITCIIAEDNGGCDDGDVESCSDPSMKGLVAWLAKLLAFFRNA